MIKLQAPDFEIDLSTYGVSLKEESNLFTDNIYKSYSLPFSIKADALLLMKLNLPTLENIYDLETTIKCRLVLDDIHFPATWYLGEVHGDIIECTLTYGDAELPVYDVPLRDLPWPKIINLNVANFANTYISQSWPAVAFNFPMVYRPEIKEESNYELFEGFLNNHNGSTFLINEEDNSGAEPVFINRNVLAPFPYLLEILKFGYKQAGLQVFGEIFEHEILKKALYVPDGFLEKFKGDQYETFSFTTPTETDTTFLGTYGVYTKTYVPEAIGTYEIAFNLDLDPVLARVFELRITRRDALSNDIIETIYSASSMSNRVTIEEKININITDASQYDPIEIQLYLMHTTESIAAYNNFEYSFKGGRLNEFPDVFSLAAFVPDMTFGEYVNLVKNWLNLDIDVQDRFVDINFTQKTILQKEVDDHSHLELPEPPFQYNSNRFYKLHYANGEKVFFNRTGQVYSDLDDDNENVIKIEMPVQPLVVERIKNITTAIFPKNKSKLDFCLYDGEDVAGRPTCNPAIARKLNLQPVVDDHWKEWLGYRVRSKTYKENFECSVHEGFSINRLSFKYNELHVLKKISKKFINEKLMKVELESETF